MGMGINLNWNWIGISKKCVELKKGIDFFNFYKKSQHKCKNVTL